MHPRCIKDERRRSRLRMQGIVRIVAASPEVVLGSIRRPEVRRDKMRIGGFPISPSVDSRSRRVRRRLSCLRFGHSIVQRAHIEHRADRSEPRLFARARYDALPIAAEISRPDLDFMRAVRHEHVVAQRRDAFVVIELVAAIVLLGAATEHLDQHRRVGDGILVAASAQVTDIAEVQQAADPDARSVGSIDPPDAISVDARP